MTLAQLDALFNATTPREPAPVQQPMGTAADLFAAKAAFG